MPEAFDIQLSQKNAGTRQAVRLSTSSSAALITLLSAAPKRRQFPNNVMHSRQKEKSLVQSLGSPEHSRGHQLPAQRPRSKEGAESSYSTQREGCKAGLLTAKKKGLNVPPDSELGKAQGVSLGHTFLVSIPGPPHKPAHVSALSLRDSDWAVLVWLTNSISPFFRDYVFQLLARTGRKLTRVPVVGCDAPSRSPSHHGRLCCCCSLYLPTKCRSAFPR